MKDIKENPRVKTLIECFEEVFVETINDSTNEIMSLKSFSYGEALSITMSLLRQGIEPKSEQFYEKINNIKTSWEY